MTMMVAMALMLAGPGAVPATATIPARDAAFRRLSDGEYAWRRTLTGPGEDAPASPNATLPDVSPAAQAAMTRRWTDTLAALDRIDPATLSPAARDDYIVYRAQVATLLARQQFREYEKPLNADTSFWMSVADMARADYRDEAALRLYLSQLASLPRYYDQQIANMRAGLKRGFTPPRITLQGRDAGVAEVVKAGAGEASPFYAPFKTLPATIPPARQAALRAEAKRVIAAAVVPAHATLMAFLRDTYIPQARTGLAAYDLPDGHAYYRSKVREFVTRDLSPEDIHAIGLREVARIRDRMQQVMTQVGWKGDLPSFLNHLRTDPQFYAKTPQELLDRAAWISKTFDGKVATYFGRLPRMRFAIKSVAPDIAPFYTSGRGGPGIYLVNTYDLPSRGLYSLPALTLHESAPGHAFQMPFAMELTDLPEYRRNEYLSAYGEGWALYCEALGEDMGMYATPYEIFGMLSYQMWRAARLVVDTGIHAKGWTREAAQAYLRDNTALSNHEITTEVDRYIAWPGQALSYYMGELAFLDARARAQKALGDKFDYRAFHDAMLSLGSVPLPMIDARADRFIADKGKGPYPMP
ncbi:MULTISPECIES: DUF885 domain-containing protein [unclassified Sphingomonas]|uniref:DUF885 domain-containing protein n=1 Tax=unclassified Sphingomonas TaxID=196159 RepID=UPI0006FF86A6|nr:MULTISPECIES: DUF885 family protein [unclassified Sphingomonas]KQM23891.1 hypothetical protein ASE58_16490 [Sphingomonas sp. Leaf9]KQM42019.1 hypothetical protein ASE57_16495 [Sphingomonas sp. Leaf11]